MTEDRQQEAARHFRIPLLGLEIEKRTDILALSAFLLALAGIAYQLFAYFQGPVVRLFEPEVILINFEKFGKDQTFMRINASMAYVNLGDPGYNATIRKERVEFGLSDEIFEQHGQAFLESVKKNGDSLVLEYKSDARPFPVAARAAESHDTYFAPRSVVCRESDKGCDPGHHYLDPIRFVKLIGKQDMIRFRFFAEMVGGETLAVECDMAVPNEFLTNLMMHGWVVAPCAPQ
jgi:hypothetical protein